MTTLLRNVGDALAQAQLSLVVLGLVLHLASLLLTAERWRMVIAALGGRVSLARTALVNLAGMFVRNITPTTGLGGDVSRIVLLRGEGLGLVEASAAFAYVKLGEVPHLVLMAALAAWAAAGVISRPGRGLATLVAAVCLLIGLGWVVCGRIRSLLAGLLARTGRLRIDLRTMGFTTFYGLLAQSEGMVRLLLVAAAFGTHLTIQQSAAVISITIIGGFVPTVGGVGPIEGGMIGGLMAFGVSGSTAVAITLVDRVVSYVLDTALGAVAVVLLGGRTMLRAARGWQSSDTAGE